MFFRELSKSNSLGPSRGPGCATQKEGLPGPKDPSIGRPQADQMEVWGRGPQKKSPWGPIMPYWGPLLLSPLGGLLIHLATENSLRHT